MKPSGGRRRGAGPRRYMFAGAISAAFSVVAVSAAVLWFWNPFGGASPLSTVSVNDIHSLAFGPGSAEEVFFGHHDGVLRSTDGGRSWQAMPFLTADAMTLAIPRGKPDVVYLAGHGVFLRSNDWGKTWQSVTSTLPGLDLHWFAVHPDAPGRLYVQVAGTGLFESMDEGATWVRWPLTVPEGESFTALTVLGGSPANVLAGTEDGRVLYSHDGGQSWEAVARFTSTVTAFALNADARSVYLGTLGGVYRSQDGGVTWNALPLRKPVRALAAIGAEPETVLFVTNQGEVFRLRGGGTRGWSVE